jgi:transcription elongation factor GreA
LESKLSRAEVIYIKKIAGKSIKFGASVTIYEESAGEEITYRIVGVDEADIKKRLLSVEAPLAKALIGKNVGDEVKLETPSGKKKYEVVKIEYI